MDKSIPPEQHDAGGEIDPLLDTAPAAFFTIDDAGIVRLANGTLARLVGRSRHEIEGRHIDQLLPVAGRIFYNTHLFPMLRLHGRAEELYVPLLHADGTEIPVLINGATRQEGDESRHDLIAVPMRERNRLEDELIAARDAAQGASAAKDRFVSVVSHELRSPLAGVSGFADLLLRERAGPLTDVQRRYVERIRDAATYQVGLIEDILEFAAIAGERRAVAAIALSAEDVISRAEAILTMRAAETGHAIERHPTPAPGLVRADAAAAQQILLNLGVNAMKYSPPGSPISLVITNAEGRARFAIVDQGPGIAPDQIERIFEPFVQLEELAANGRRGVGLGLAISRDLARAMGGEIHVESTPGSGSTFTLELPSA